MKVEDFFNKAIHFSSFLFRGKPQVVLHLLGEHMLELKFGLRSQRLDHRVVLVLHHLFAEALPLSPELFLDCAFLRKQHVREGGKAVARKLLCNQLFCHVADKRQTDLIASPRLKYLNDIGALQPVNELELRGRFLLDEFVLVTFV